jgi:hypothetical protein
LVDFLHKHASTADGVNRDVQPQIARRLHEEPTRRKVSEALGQGCHDEVCLQ